ncbi:hypothetical protein [Streptomyces abyssalis]|uniref:hypothetical protein n=1 Tax=Streptomyces abyssalis TaxID=933944 RepID=UPI00085C2774|nr:hypothetical protein [Streptomyces abyssalis]
MRRSARSAAAVAAAAAIALLLSGCGSGDDTGGKDDGGGGEQEKSAPPSESASPSEPSPDQPSEDDAPEGGSGDGGDGGSGKAGKLAGVWKAKGKQYVLTFVGDEVTLLRVKGRNCTGGLGGADGRSLNLKCPDGGDQTRTNGTVGAVKGKSVKVSWKGGPTEVYARVTDVPVELPESPES